MSAEEEQKAPVSRSLLMLQGVEAQDPQLMMEDLIDHL